jgi:hypothetical protein
MRRPFKSIEIRTLVRSDQNRLAVTANGISQPLHQPISQSWLEPPMEALLLFSITHDQFRESFLPGR